MRNTTRDATREQDANSRMRGVAIVGNMCVGKSTIFAKMCGTDTKSVNYPGTTVSISAGAIKGIDGLAAFDTPGTCSIFTHNEDERVSRDFFLSFDRIKKIKNIGLENDRIEGALLVADAKNLKRSLALAIQYAEYSVPMLFNLNMMDEIDSRGIEIDLKRLSEILGVDVCSSIATEGVGIKEIKAKLTTSMRIPNKLIKYPQKIEEFIRITEKLLSQYELKDELKDEIKEANYNYRGIALLLLVADKSAENYIKNIFGEEVLNQLKDLRFEYQKSENTPYNILITNLFNKKAEEILKEVQQLREVKKSVFTERLGHWCMQVKTGVPIAIVVIYVMYIFIGVFSATYVVDMINDKFFSGIIIPFCNKLFSFLPSPFIRDMFMDADFGILPAGVFLALGLVLPVLFCFYIFFGVLEDSGYLPRLSFLLDKVLQKIGLNGKGVVPLIMGLSCVTMAVLTTRMLDTKKERTLATFLLLLGFPCAPVLGLMFIILGRMPFTATLAVFGTLSLQVLVAGYFANKLLFGKRTPLLLEITPMRIPHMWSVIKRAALRVYFFMKEAIPIFIFASVVLFLFQRSGGLAILENLLKPVVGNLMGLPEKSIQVFIKTMIRKENGATELKHLIASGGVYTNLQLVVNLLAMTFLLPCLNTFIVVVKERGPKIALAIVSLVMIWAIIISSAVNHTCHIFGITFM
ncbi:MAG: ferrous iron transporter B [Oligoflexia bacterium]|nr:ferrous iron transporter B [Oligoflexia bacterium]